MSNLKFYLKLVLDLIIGICLLPLTMLFFLAYGFYMQIYIMYTYFLDQFMDKKLAQAIKEILELTKDSLIKLRDKSKENAK
jgi:uncharacterized protein YneF (UPF0154 family)